MNVFSLYKKFIILLFVSIHLAGCRLPGLDRFLLDLSTWNLFQSILGRNITIGGEVRGLLGQGLRLRLVLTQSEGETTTTQLEISQNGGFRFLASPEAGASYEVTIAQQPSNPAQFCEVAGGSGTIGNQSVNSILVQCGESLAVATPVFTPLPGEFFTGINVSITSETLGSQIFYTLDGAEPNCEGVGTEYTAAVSINSPSGSTAETRILRAIACKEDANSGETLSSNLQVGNYFMTLGQLPAPQTSLAPGPYTNDPVAPETLLSSPGAPAGANVHFTTDNTPATCSSPIYNGDPIQLNFSQTIRAITCLTNYTASSEVSFSYTITGTVAAPSFNPPHTDGPFNNDVNLVITSPTPGSTVRYSLTTNGDPPDDPDCSTDFPAVSGSVLLNQNNSRIKAIACFDGWTDSPILGDVTYNFETAINPAFNLPSGTSITTSTTISTGSATTGATIHYFQSIVPPPRDPNCSDPTTPIDLTADGSEEITVIQAIACRNGFLASLPIQSSYNLTGILDPPTVGLDSGEYPGTQSVSFTGVGVSGQEFAYTLDGSEPSCDSSPTTPDSINIESSGTLRVRACKETTPRWEPSSVVTRVYTINGQATMPNFDPPPGSFPDIVNVTISSAVPSGGVIHFSLTGGMPNCFGANVPNGGVLQILQTDTDLSAIVCEDTHLQSELAEGTYVLRPNQPAPIGGNDPGVYQSNLTLELEAPDSPGATVYWTIDGSSPSCPNTGNTGDINLTMFQGDVNVQAIACRENFTPSILFNQVYTMRGQLPAPEIGDPSGAANLVMITAQNAPGSGPVAGDQTICYRTDGGTAGCVLPTAGSCAPGSTNYSDPIPIAGSTTISAVSCRAGFTASNPASKSINFADTVGSVVFDPPEATFNNLFDLEMTVPGGADEIRYTVNGSAPNCATGDLYGGAFTIGPSGGGGFTVVQAIACSEGLNPSPVVTANYQFQAAAPEFDLAEGEYTEVRDLEITTNTTTGNIFYTLNGTDPGCVATGDTFAWLGGAVTLPTTAPFDTQTGELQIRARACAADFDPSPVVERNYIFRASPVVLSIGNTVLPETPSSLTLNPFTFQWDAGDAGDGKSSCFTTNGVDPVCDATTPVDCTTGFLRDTGEYDFGTGDSGTLKVVGCAPGFASSIVRTLNLTITDPETDFRPRIFVSAVKVNGNTSDNAAFQVCNTDDNRPDKSGNREYTHFRLGTNRNYLADRTINWMLEPNTTYYNLKNQVVASTSANGAKFGNVAGDIQLQNPITDIRYDVWTGVSWNAAEERMQAISNCATDHPNNSWNTTSGTGTIGFSERTDIFSVRHTIGISCANINHLYCVEKHPRKRIWLTENLYPANEVVDASCNLNADNNKPITGGYAALRGHSTLRIPGTANWMLKNDTIYYSVGRDSPIFTTNNQGFIQFPLINQLTTSSISPWTGLNVVSGIISVANDNNCADWTITTTGSARAGNAISTTETFIQSVIGPNCDATRALYCVEQ